MKNDKFKKMIPSREEKRKNILKELLELLEEELDLEELNQLQELFLPAEKEESGERKSVFAQIVSEFIGIINANTQDRILYAKITYFYGNRPAQLVPCKISDKLGGRPLGRPLSRGDSVWLEFDPKKPSFLQYYNIVSTANYW